MPNVYGCFQTPWQNLLVVAVSVLTTHKPEVFTIWLFKESLLIPF